MKVMQKMLKPSKTLWAVLLLCALVYIPNLAQAQENQGQRQKLVYEVYAGGIHAVQAKMDIDTTKPDTYTIIMQAATRGFLEKMVPWKGTFESYGWKLDNGRYQTQKHLSTAVWREERDIKEYIYNKDGTFKSLTTADEKSDSRLREVDSALTNGTIDTLTATLQVLEKYNQSGKCEGTSEVFDGKRRFEQVFTHQNTVELKKSKYNLYEGTAAECIVEVIPISGKWHEKPRGWLSIQEQGRERGTMPTVWIGKMSENGPAIPVKIRVKTAYGTLFMHLAEYEAGD